MEEPLDRRMLYPLFPAASVVCRSLGVDLAAVAAGVGLEDAGNDFSATLVDAATYFSLWDEALLISGRADAAVFLGKTMATGPVIPAFFALSSAPTLRIGFKRLGRYKRLIGPTAIGIEEGPDAFTLTFYSEDPSIAMPASLGALHLVFAAERARTLTARPVIPIKATQSLGAGGLNELAECIGIVPMAGEFSSISFDPLDVDAPLLSRDDALWEEVERDLEIQQCVRDALSPMAARTMGALIELLPAGDATAARVADTLGLSISTLQRRLGREGKFFKALVRETREYLAKRYLTKTDITPKDVSSLLGYREPNSFYRSFKLWTGVTPTTYRQQRRPVFAASP